MFGGYLALQRQEEDNLRVEHRLRTAYDKLKKINEENPLLSLLELKDDPNPSMRPDLCPTRLVVRFTPDLLSKYQINQTTLDQRISVFGFPEEFLKYVADLETEVQRLETNSQRNT